MASEDAPELYGNAISKAPEASDMWTFGMLLCVLASGAPPFSSTESKAYDELLEGGLAKLPSVAAMLPTELHATIESMLRRDPAARPLALQVASKLRAVATEITAECEKIPPAASVKRDISQVSIEL